MKRLASMAVAAAGFLCGLGQNDAMPLHFDKENTAPMRTIAMPTLEHLPAIPELPNPFVLADGTDIADDGAVTIEEWEQKRGEIMQQLYHYEIGQKPSTPRDSIGAKIDNDTLRIAIHNNGKTLCINAPIVYPDGDGPFPVVIGVGLPSGSLPPQLFKNRGIAMIGFPFWQVMSHTQTRGTEPINDIYPEHVEMGAYSAWPWGISRIIDALEIVGPDSRIDTSRIGVTGCSFAGKMALFAGALDERIKLTIAQEPGGGGAAAWRVSETLGNVETLGRTNYSWFMESMRQFAEDNVPHLPIDHHLLVSLVAPRALIVIGNTDYEWLADESGYVSCCAARHVWDSMGVSYRMGYTIEDNHMHCMLPPLQYDDVCAFIERFLLNVDDADTEVTKAPMFDAVDLKKWMPWAGK